MHRMATAALLALVLLFSCGTFAHTLNAPLDGVKGAVGSSPFFGETTVSLTKSAGHLEKNPLTLQSTLDEAASCDDGVAQQTVTGSGILSGSVFGAFSLADVTVTTTLHCGAREVGEPVLDIVTKSKSQTGPLRLDIGGGESKNLSSYSISASIYDDAETGGHFIAGTLRGAEGGGGDIYWFDTCTESFEVRDTPSLFPLAISFLAFRQAEKFSLRSLLFRLCTIT